MKRTSLRRILTGMVLASVVAGGPGINALAGQEATGQETGIFDASKDASVNAIGNPVSKDGVTTWDCVWFGNYWQEDTNGDGVCVKEDYGDYEQDDKQPVKWRVLSVDASGNALLLADKNIEIREYNTTDTDVTWETCTLRSFLNSYGPESNICEEDYEAAGFLTTAFNAKERSAIKTAFTANPNNPIYDTKGGNDTKDKVFLLSLDEAMNPNYGFTANHLKHEYYEGRYSTDADATRTALNTGFVDFKPGYEGNDKDAEDVWWMRTPGESADYASSFYNMGAANASGRKVSDKGTAVRPALYLDLSSSLWEPAGTVCSDGTVASDETVENTIETLTDNAAAKPNRITLNTTSEKVWTLSVSSDSTSSDELMTYIAFKPGIKVKLNGYDKKLSKQFKKENKLSKKTATITSKGVIKVKKKAGTGTLKYATKDGDIVTVKYIVE